jgi:histidinol-phosphate aminotransferase
MTTTATNSESSPRRRFGTRTELAAIESYKAGTSTRILRTLSGRTDVAALASNENPLGASPAAVKAAVAAMESAHCYPDSAARSLSAALAERHGVATGNVVTGNGADNVLRTIALGLLRHGDEAVVPSPSFSVYETDSILAGATVRVASIEEGDPTDAVVAAITPKTKVVWLASPNNPTGAAMNTADLERIVAALPDLATLVVDQAYWEFSPDGAAIDALPLVRRGAPVVVVRTFSKAYGLAGLRIGYLCGPAPIVQELLKVREPFTLSNVAESAAVAALDDHEHLTATLDLVARGRERLTAALRERGLTVGPTHGNFVWVDLGVDAAAVAETLSYRGVAIRPGTAWQRPTFARITIGTEAQHELLLAELDREMERRWVAK